MRTTRPASIRPTLHRAALRALLVVPPCLAPTTLAQATITDLGVLPGAIESRAIKMSADGAVVVGSCTYPDAYHHAFRWTLASGLQDLGHLPRSVSSEANGVSADGSVVCGTSTSSGFPPRAWRWTSAGGLQNLGVLPGGSQSWGYAISRDGSAITGRSDSAQSVFPRAIRWTSAAGMQSLGLLSGGYLSEGYAISGDGSVVVGVSTISGGSSRAIRWTSASGVQDLGTLPGGRSSSAQGVSADGAVVVGHSNGTGINDHAFRWTSAGGMQDLGVVPGGVLSFGLAVSGDGTIVVGASDDGTGFNQLACAWTAALGMVNLNTWLPTRGVDLTGWVLQKATSVSDDGSVITGIGTFNGSIRAYVVTGITGLGPATAIFPDEYSGVPEGPLEAPNLPLANGISRVQCLYEAIDVGVPSGHQITKLGFRQDGATAQVDAGRTLQLEIRMGWSTFAAANVTSTFDSNFVSPPVTVFGPAPYVLPDLRDPADPLPAGQFFVPLTTPFVYAPAAGQNLLVEYRISGTSGGGTPWTYRLDRADAYSPVSYGVPGCAHAGGTPNLTVSPTRPGLDYSAAVTSGPSSSACVLALAPGSHLVAPFPLTPFFPGINPACTGQVSLVVLTILVGATAANGSVQWSFPIPDSPGLADVPISSQVFFLDFASPGGIVVSRGAEVLTGARPRSTIVHAVGSPSAVTSGIVLRNYCPVAFFQHQ